MTSMKVATVLMTITLCAHNLVGASDRSCRQVIYNVSNLNQHNIGCQNDTIINQGREMDKLNTRMSTLEKQIQELLNKSTTECKVELVSVGFEDPLIRTGFRGYISVNNVQLPITAFPHYPMTKTGLRGLQLVTLWKCQVIHTGIYDTNSHVSAAINLDSHLKSIKSGSVVLGICVDACRYNLKPASITFQGMGINIQGIRNNLTTSWPSFSEKNNIWTRSSVAFVAKKGKPSETVMVQLPREKGPARLTHVIQD